MSSLAEKRLAFVGIVLAQEGKPYLWNMNGPDAFDCSGLMVFGFRHPDVYGPRYADRSCVELWRLPRVVIPQPGHLAIYRGKAGTPKHVMVCVDGGPHGRVFGACGGDERTTTLAIAAAMGASVRFRDSPLYRPGLMGFVDPFQEKTT